MGKAKQVEYTQILCTASNMLKVDREISRMFSEGWMVCRIWNLDRRLVDYCSTVIKFSRPIKNL